MSEIKYIDLFCGLGAFHTAFDSLSSDTIKYKCVFACDINEPVRNLYHANHGITPHGDINTIEVATLPDFDILCAGFPCQPFSIAGKQQGFNDANKGNLFFSILKIIDCKQPSTLILENVKNLQTIHGGNTFERIVGELEQRGYKVSYKVIDSKFYNSPQSRQRLFIICSKFDKYDFAPPPMNSITPVSSVIDTKETIFLQYEEKYNLVACTGTHRINNCNMLYKIVNKLTNKGGRQGERVYSIDSCGPTICASSGGPGAKTGLYYIDKKVRRLNVVEGLKMFGYPDSYKWQDIVKKEEMLFYLGNSIVVDVLKAILPQIQTENLTDLMSKIQL